MLYSIETQLWGGGKRLESLVYSFCSGLWVAVKQPSLFNGTFKQCFVSKRRLKMRGDRNTNYLICSASTWIYSMQCFVGYKFASIIWMMMHSKQFFNVWVFSVAQKQQLRECKFWSSILYQTTPTYFGFALTSQWS